jgi:single-strand DNA-binding protein
LFGKRAEGKLKDYLVKGQAVAFSGELSMREYKANDGTMKTSVELNANVLDLVGKKSDSPPPTPPQPGGGDAPCADFDSDIPF